MSNDTHSAEDPSAPATTGPSCSSDGTESETPPSGFGEPAESGCPTPLAWNQVLKEFVKQSESISGESNGIPYSGRVLGEGTPLYFLNGLSATPELFCLSVWLLRDEFRCVILDYPDESRTFDDLSDSLFAMASELGDESFDLYATSFGSTAGIHAMLRAPERISRAVLQGPVVSVRFSIPERIALTTLGWIPGEISRLPLRNTVLENNHRRWFPPFDITRWRFLLEQTGAVSTRAVAHRTRMLRGLDVTEKLSEVQTPTLVISSEGEAARHREAAKILQQKMPNAVAEEISNTGHVPFVTHPHKLTKLVRQFLHPDAHAPS